MSDVMRESVKAALEAVRQWSLRSDATMAPPLAVMTLLEWADGESARRAVAVAAKAEEVREACARHLFAELESKVGFRKASEAAHSVRATLLTSTLLADEISTLRARAAESKLREDCSVDGHKSCGADEYDWCHACMANAYRQESLESRAAEARAEKAEARVAELEESLADSHRRHAETERDASKGYARAQQAEAEVKRLKQHIDGERGRQLSAREAQRRICAETLRRMPGYEGNVKGQMHFAVAVVETANLDETTEKIWRCFLCDEVFTTESDARDHFSDGHERPGCVDPLAKDEKARLKELRDARELARRALSDAEVANSTARARGDHLAQLRAERDRMEAQRDKAEAQVMGLGLDRWPVLAPFVAAMVRKLDANKPKKGGREGWQDDDPRDLLVRVREEVVEVERLLLNISPRGDSLTAAMVARFREDVLNEAADVANMAMMVADASGAIDAPASSTPTKPPPALVVRTAGECVFWVANGRGWLLEAGRWVPLDVAPGLAGILLTAREVEQLVADVGCPP